MNSEKLYCVFLQLSIIIIFASRSLVEAMSSLPAEAAAVSYRRAMDDSESLALTSTHGKSSGRASRHAHTTYRSGHNSAMAECEVAYEERIAQHCRYPGTIEPCYNEDLGDLKVYEDAHHSHHHRSPVQSWIKSLSHHCCIKNDNACALHRLEKLCCRTPECLKKCYGEKLALEIASKDPNMFQYFELLVRPTSEEN
ncbi:hypothetical protein Ddc_06563 [Ditylenchus destructor]|nr:hypothetical protein Ddc_06563 [Ditylenchus destructor]